MKNLKSILLLLTASAIIAGCGDSDKNKSASKWTAAGIPASLHDAAFLGDVQSIKKHIAEGANLNQKNSDQGNTPLIIAAVFDRKEALEELIKGGADLNLQNNDGATALSSAAFFCHADIVKALLKAGADKSLTNKFGSTALESVQAPFEGLEEVYKIIGDGLAPLGVKLNFAQIKTDRSKIARLLQ